MLPFLENAFKHGTSEQIEKSWLSVDVSVEGNQLKVKIANSKNAYATGRDNGIGIGNIRKRLEFIYPHKHELKLSDEGHFFVISLMIQLTDEATVQYPFTQFIHQPIHHETEMPAYR
jgi:LytS/YehU family sensor histidine kinase